MGNLSKLPRELVHHICAQIHHDEEQIDFAQDWVTPQRALHSLCRVSRLLKEIAQPLLYRQVIAFVSEITKPRYLSLLRTMTSHPDLSQQVRHLRFVYDVPFEYDYDDFPPPQDLTWLHKATARHSNYMQHLPESWPFDDIFRPDVLIDLLFTNLPNIETIHVHLPEVGTSFAPFDRLVDNIKSGCHVFNHIKSVTLHPDLDPLYWEYGVPLEHFQAIMGLFSNGLTRLSLRRCWAMELFGMDFSFLNVRELILHQCLLTERSMKKWMGACKDLRHFTYISANLTQSQEPISPDECLTALQKHSSTLTKLYLQVLSQKTKTIWRGGFRTFKTFTKLESLTVYPPDFGSHFVITTAADPLEAAKIQTLPVNLKHLTVIRWCWPMENDLVWLSEAGRRGELDNLETLEIQYFKSAKRDIRQMTCQVKDRLKEGMGTDVAFSVTVTKMPGKFEDPRK